MYNSCQFQASLMQSSMQIGLTRTVCSNGWPVSCFSVVNEFIRKKKANRITNLKKKKKKNLSSIRLDFSPNSTRSAYNYEKQWNISRGINWLTILCSLSYQLSWRNAADWHRERNKQGRLKSKSEKRAELYRQICVYWVSKDVEVIVIRYIEATLLMGGVIARWS